MIFSPGRSLWIHWCFRRRNKNGSTPLKRKSNTFQSFEAVQFSIFANDIIKQDFSLSRSKFRFAL